MTQQDEGKSVNRDTDFERSDMSVTVLAILAAVVVAYVCLAPFVLTRIYQPALRDVSRQLDIAPPGPRLQLDPPRDLAAFRAHEETQLDSYGWVDRDQGIAHIPIAEAMKDLAARGIPGFPKAQP